MGAFGGLQLTNKGIALQAKAQAGAELHYTRVAIGDGYLGGQSIATLTNLISEKKSLDITKLKKLGQGRAVIGAVLTNQDIATGFYFREIGMFADDPDEGEILYAYANAGNNAEYIPPGGGPDVVEKHIDSVVVVGQAANVTATIDQSLVFATLQDLDDHKYAAVLDHPDGSVTTAKLADGAVTAAKVAADVAKAADLAAHVNATTGVHGATSAATPNRIVQRDSAGRFKAAAPSAADDVARKAEVDEKLSRAPRITPNLNNEKEAGWVMINADTINRPPSVPWGICRIEERPGDSSYQTVYRTDTNAIRIFVRKLLSGTWTDWVEMWHSGILPYETGEWTPELRFGGATTGITYGARSGRYTLIGNVVHWALHIDLTSKGSATGDATIAGLPFTSINGHPNPATAIGAAANLKLPNGAYWAYGLILNGSTQIILRASGDVSLTTSLNDSHFSGNTVIRAEGKYYI